MANCHHCPMQCALPIWSILCDVNVVYCKIYVSSLYNIFLVRKHNRWSLFADKPHESCVSGCIGMLTIFLLVMVWSWNLYKKHAHYALDETDGKRIHLWWPCTCGHGCVWPSDHPPRRNSTAFWVHGCLSQHSVNAPANIYLSELLMAFLTMEAALNIIFMSSSLFTLVSSISWTAASLVPFSVTRLALFPRFDLWNCTSDISVSCSRFSFLR